PGVITGSECLRRPFRLVDDGRETAFQRVGRIGPGVLRNPGEAEVDRIEDAGLVLLHLSRDARIDQLVGWTAGLPAAWTATAAEPRQRRHAAASALTLVIAASVGADFRVGGAKQRVK